MHSWHWCITPPHLLLWYHLFHCARTFNSTRSHRNKKKKKRDCTLYFAPSLEIQSTLVGYYSKFDRLISMQRQPFEEALGMGVARLHSAGLPLVVMTWRTTMWMSIHLYGGMYCHECCCYFDSTPSSNRPALTMLWSRWKFPASFAFRVLNGNGDAEAPSQKQGEKLCHSISCLFSIHPSIYLSTPLSIMLSPS